MGASLVFLVFGIVLMQTREYIGHCLEGKRRRRRTSALVSFVFTMCITNCVLVTHLNCFRAEDPATLGPDYKKQFLPMKLAFTAMNGSVACGVIAFFAQKIWVLGRPLRYSWRIGGVVCTIYALALLHAVSAAMSITAAPTTFAGAEAPILFLTQDDSDSIGITQNAAWFLGLRGFGRTRMVSVASGRRTWFCLAEGVLFVANEPLDYLARTPKNGATSLD